MASLSLYNGVSENWTFNPLLQPGELTAKLGSTTLMDLTWSYNAGTGSVAGTDNGNVVSQTIARSSGLTGQLTQNFTYADPANRLLTAAEVNGWSQGYNYDAFGNRTVTATSYLPNEGYTPQGTVAGQGNGDRLRNSQTRRELSSRAPGFANGYTGIVGGDDDSGIGLHRRAG